MPHAVMVHCFPEKNFHLIRNEGRHTHALLLNFLKETDPVLSESLHEGNSLRSFTASRLIVKSRYKRRNRHDDVIEGGTPCKLRFTFLDDVIFPVFMKGFFSKDAVQIHETFFRIENVDATGEDIWSGFSPYKNILNNASRSEREIRLKFFSPTTFRQGDADLPLPIPRLVFNSYAKKWAMFAPEYPLPENFDELLENCVYLNYHDIESKSVMDKRSRMTAFMGNVGFCISAKAPAPFIHFMNVLANYAIYAGTGRKTTMGMGQTLRVNSFKDV